MGKFLMQKTETGIVFYLRAVNGEAIGVSKSYSSAENCRKGIETIKEIAATAAIEDQTHPRARELKNPKFEIYKDENNKFCFRLKGSDGENLLTSQSYTAKASCKNGIQSVMSNAVSSIVIEALGE